MKIKAVGKNIVIKLDPVPEKVGNIVVPNSGETIQMVGTVLSIGQEVSYVTEGDRVRLLKDYDISPIDKDENLCVCEEGNIAGIILE